jgi:hypothetical protein
MPQNFCQLAWNEFMTKPTIFFLTIFCLAACVSNRGTDQTAAPENKAPNITAAVTAVNENRAETKSLPPANATKRAEVLPPKSECLNVEAGDKAVQEKQTFPIDFEPFRTSCFVTAYNPEFDDPPLESEFAIYTDGKEVFKFPDQFNGVQFGCWVTGVAFQDLNADGLTDIIVAGMCSAKTAPYSENMVYANTGKSFVTNIEANYKLQDFKKISEIEKFVKANQGLFFK